MEKIRIMARVYQGSELQKEQIGGYPGVHLPRRPSTLLHISSVFGALAATLLYGPADIGARFLASRDISPSKIVKPRVYPSETIDRSNHRFSSPPHVYGAVRPPA